jgi:hypothetical protein
LGSASQGLRRENQTASTRCAPLLAKRAEHAGPSMKTMDRDRDSAPPLQLVDLALPVASSL